MRENIDGCLAWVARNLALIGLGVAVFACIGTYIGLKPIFWPTPPPPNEPHSIQPTPSSKCVDLDSARIVKYPTQSVSAKELWHDTGIKIENGDCIEFSAAGSWWNGISLTGPDGDTGWFIFRGPQCGECPAPEGNLGELVGRVDKGFPFRIGNSSTQKIKESGNLLLAMNDNAGSCEGGPAGSCYPKNNGKLNVDITVFHKQ